MDLEEQIRQIFDNEISYNIVYNSGIQDDISFIIEDDTFLVGDLRSTISCTYWITLMTPKKLVSN